MKKFIAIVWLAGIISCSQTKYYIENPGNPAFVNNTAFVAYEDLSQPKFDSLRLKYRMDTVFHGEKDEFKRILLLRNWIREVMAVNDYASAYPGSGSAEGILDAALQGNGYHCAHFTEVQNAVMNAYGYVTRCLGSGPGVKGVADGHHGINEIWLNKYHKWFLSDAKYNHHFEKNGIPLSALEIRDEYLMNKAADIILVKGPGRIPIDADGVADKNKKLIAVSRSGFAQWYTWIEWDMNNDRYTRGPSFHSKLNMYRDNYFKEHTWIWDGKPHWAYNTPNVNYIDARSAIEWTPNTISSEQVIGDNTARIKLTSITPNFREYQMKRNAHTEWIKCDSEVTVPLNKDVQEIVFRVINQANVAGPEYKLAITSR